MEEKNMWSRLLTTCVIASALLSLLALVSVTSGAPAEKSGVPGIFEVTNQLRVENTRAER